MGDDGFAVVVGKKVAPDSASGVFIDDGNVLAVGGPRVVPYVTADVLVVVALGFVDAPIVAVVASVLLMEVVFDDSSVEFRTTEVTGNLGHTIEIGVRGDLIVRRVC